MLQPPILTQSRVRLAYAVAVAADFLQVMLGPLGWAFADEIIDVTAMVLTIGAIGFHPLLLPTFVVEFIPLVDMLPSWTACVAHVAVSPSGVMIRIAKRPLLIRCSVSPGSLWWKTTSFRANVRRLAVCSSSRTCSGGRSASRGHCTRRA